MARACGVRPSILANKAFAFQMAIGTMFSLLDAFNIGASKHFSVVISQGRRANISDFPFEDDVANSWATSVSSRSLSLRQAVIGAAIFEFLGAVTVGARVAGTIKNGIIVSQFPRLAISLSMPGF